jgi:lipopolysaccharide export system permease protein
MRSRILFITSNRVGDAVLTTGVLSWLLERHPQARLTVACGPLAEEIFAGIPQLERLIPMKKGKLAAHWRRLWLACIGTRWDLVVDLRHSAFSWLVWTSRRIVFSPSPQPLHQLEQLARAVGAAPMPLPRLWLTEAQRAEAARLLPDGGPVLALGPTANWTGKQWGAGNYAALVRRLTAEDGLFPGARVAVFGGPGEHEAAAPLLDSIPENRRIDLVGKSGLGLAGACLARCALYIGNDSGLMHLAGAAGIPVVGLFGPSREEIYGPRGEKSIALRTPESFEDFQALRVWNIRNATGLLDSIPVERVAEAATRLLVPHRQ